ncbi:MAG: hypothetical protein HC853_00795 [Anaerolineae bacterium]|nr:hypothetical protein [Anaerolineae bacterium]
MSDQTINFTVDAALLRELGERLVGAAHIALAELVKNSYDADANQVVLRFLSNPARIEIVDDGNGMTFEEFRDFWMRIGTPHKQTQRESPRLHRPLTGSKGVGRLAVQFLASHIELHTASIQNDQTELSANVDWAEAVRAGDLVKAKAKWSETDKQTVFAARKTHGTRIILSGLKQSWTPEEVENLAREVWWLQPPFLPNPAMEASQAFKIKLESADSEAIERFDNQMRAAQNNWYARISGQLVPNSQAKPGESRKVELLVEFRGGEKIPQTFEWSKCYINSARFEIRVYYLVGKQKQGIDVGFARDYFKEYGGVHVYDSGFHLPYYGPKTDWLRLETDHSHRLHVSELLPEELQVSRGLNFLPTQQRIFGIVHVNTALEREWFERIARQKTKKTNDKEVGADDQLMISVTRDRLIDNSAFKDLQKIVRWALDFYANREAERKYQEAAQQKPTEPLGRTFERVDKVLDSYQGVIADNAFEELRTGIQTAIDAAERQEEFSRAQTGLLGALATAGISALAYEHEVYKQFALLEDVQNRLAKIRVSDTATQRAIEEIGRDLKEWISRARATRAIFSPLLDEENRELRERMKAKGLVDQVVSQVKPLTRDVRYDISKMDDALRLPEGRYVEWAAIFQNVFINAYNAMLDSKRKLVSVSSRSEGRNRYVLIQDTGSGVDLSTSEKLFQPFVRKLQLSQSRQQLGLGGSGLGLTIVRMIANDLDCRVEFIEPDEGSSTAFSISWREQ